MIEIWNGFQDVTVGIERSGPIDSTGGVLAREQDDFGVDESSRGDPFVQGLAESRCGCHSTVRKLNGRPGDVVFRSGAD